MITTKQGQYLWIKQRLDKYNISTTFPLQMMPLLQSLLNRLDGEVQKTNNFSYEQLKNSDYSVKQIQLTNKLIPEAMRMQISQVRNENNQLHMEIITLKQELESVKHYIDKFAIQKSDKRTQVQRIIAFKNQKQQELKEQLKLMKFKYNELMDFIHNNDSLQKMYLKRLLNHKKYDIKEDIKQSFQGLQKSGNIKGSERTSGNRQDLNSRITFNAKNFSSRKKQTRQRINQTLQQTHHHQRSSSNKTYGNEHQHVLALKKKLANRQKQIQRLQSISTFNGPDMNKVLTQFNHFMQSKKYFEINQRMEHLESENQRLIKDLKHDKNNAGRYQALKDQVDKCHQIIKNLKEQNKNIKRTLKQNNFNLEKDKMQNQRSFNVFNIKNSQLNLNKFNDDLKIEQLRKKVEFYEKQFGIVSKQQENINNKISNKQSSVVKSSQKKPKKKSIKEKNDKQLSAQRATYEDHIKLTANKTQAKQNAKKKVVKNSLNKLSNSNKKPKQISKIPEQSQQQSSVEQNKSQQQNIESNNQPLTNQAKQLNLIPYLNKPQQKQSSDSEQQSQSQQQQNHLKQRDNTLAQQYLETISELSAKCLQLKQQLQNKNIAINGLEQILNRLMEKMKQNQGQKQEKHSDNQNLEDSKEISKLKRQIQSLSSMLNQSQFQKQDLRREFIQMQKLYKKISIKQKQSTSQHVVSNLKAKIQELEQLIKQKDNKIDQMREDHNQIQDKLLKSLDRIRRLNDEIEVLTKQKQGLIKEFQLNSSRLDEAAQLLKKQRQKHSTTIELSELEKDEIIMLRKNLLNAQNKIDELQNYIYEMQENNQQQIGYDQDYK